MKKDKKFIWSSERNAAFEKLKNQHISTQILVISNKIGGMIVFNNASRRGRGSGLMQHGRVIAYSFR